MEQYKSWLIKEGDSIIGESLSTTLQPQASFVLIEQSTGEVKAISGGRGEKKANRTLNRATNAKRQPGSAFKVITSFLPAVDTCGATLGSVYYDAPYSIGDKSFRNWYANRGYMGYHNIREGIAYSMNIITLKCLVDTVTPQLGVEYAKKMGITTLVPGGRYPVSGPGRTDIRRHQSGDDRRFRLHCQRRRVQRACVLHKDSGSQRQGPD